MRCATGVSVAGSASSEILNQEFFEVAEPHGKRAGESDRCADLATVHFAAMTGALLAGWMAVRAKA
jgi:hypothetical protein